MAKTYRALLAWLGDVAAGLAGGALDPRTWHALTWALVGLLVVLLLALALRPRRRRGRLPEMMMSHGEIVLVEEAEELELVGGMVIGLEAPAGGKYFLRLALSNLNPYPVQLLELAVRTRGTRLPVVADAGAVVPPNGAVDVTADLFDLPGDGGVVELYLFSSRLRDKTFRLVAPLEWEPWARRYRVKALEGRTESVSRLASQERRRREKEAFERDRRRVKRQELVKATKKRADGVLRQVEEYRAARLEKARLERARAEQEAQAAAAATAATGAGAGASMPAGAAAGGAARPAVNRAATVPPAPAEAPSRRGLQFPDEF